MEGLLVERGVEVDHVTVYRWVQRSTPLLADAARFTRRGPGDRWFVDETYERGPAVSEALIRWAAINQMIRRLTRGGPARRQQRRTFNQPD